MGQLISFTKEEPSSSTSPFTTGKCKQFSSSSLLDGTSKSSPFRRSRRLSAFKSSSSPQTNENAKDFDDKFRKLCDYFDQFRRSSELLLASTNDSVVVSTSKLNALVEEFEGQQNRVASLESEVDRLRGQMLSIGEMINQILDISKTIGNRSTLYERDICIRIGALEQENEALRGQLNQLWQNNKVVRTDLCESTTNEDGRGPDDREKKKSTNQIDSNERGQTGDREREATPPREIASFAEHLPHADESGQLILNKFKYSCKFVELLYRGGGNYDGVSCNIFSNYPETFFEELIEHALVSQSPQEVVRRIFIWLAADEPWPDMRKLFPTVHAKEIVEDRVRYEFANSVDGTRFILRIKAPSVRDLQRKMCYFSLTRI